MYVSRVLDADTRFVSATDYSLYANALEGCAKTINGILPLRK